MKEFLQIVYTNQIENTETGDEYFKIFEPFMDRLKEILSDSLYEELEELFNTCATQNNRFYAVTGMKLAIGIMDGTFVPTC